MRRRGLALVLTSAMALAVATPGIAANNPFPDLPHDHWAYDSVTSLAEAGLIEGYPDGTFGGDRTFTRYEMAQVFARILKRMEALLLAEIDQKVNSASTSMEQRIAAAAAKAQEALTQAIQAQSMAQEARKLAQAAYDMAKAAQEWAGILPAGESSAVGNAAVIDPNSVRGIAEKALTVANEAKELAEQALGKPGVSLDEFRDAVRKAEEIAREAAELAKKAATPEDVALAQATAVKAREAAELAEKLARQAATLDDLSKTMARAEAANDAAKAANDAAKAANDAAKAANDAAKAANDSANAANDSAKTANNAAKAANDLAKAAYDMAVAANNKTGLDDATKQAINDYVAGLITGQLESVAQDASNIALPAVAAEGGLVTRADAEEIASRIVAEKMAAALGRITSLEQAQDAAKGDLEATRQLVEAKTDAIAADIAKMRAEFGPELEKLKNTKTGLRTEIVATQASPVAPNNSLYTNPREPLSNREKVAHNDWYEDRVFAKNETMLRFAYDVATVPASGSTLSGSIYVNRLFPGSISQQAGVGIDMDLTTEGVLRSLHVGELQSEQAAIGFNGYVLDPAKWDAQLWRFNGIQALLKTGNVTANVFTGFGDVKNVDITGRTGDDLAGDTPGALTAAAVEAPLSSALKLRANWLNLPVQGTVANSTPVSVAALDVSGASDTLKYSATVAAHNNAAPEVGVITLAQQIGNVEWSGDYSYTDPAWTQRLAQAGYDGLTSPINRQFALEIGGLKLLDFDVKLAHTVAYVNSVQHNVWMVRGQRDLDVVLPLQVVAEVGGNNNDSHTMLDLGVANWTLTGGKVSFDAGWRFENTPIEAEEWAARWRNPSAQNVNAVANVSPAEHQNWVPGTVRSMPRAKATWHVSDTADIYVGASLRNDTGAAAASEDIVTAGAQVQGKLFGTEAKASYELLKSSLAASPKQELALSVAGGIGQGTISAEVRYGAGQGSDTADVRNGVASLTLEVPVYEGVVFYANGKYAGLQGSAAKDYQYSTFLSGIKMAL